MPEPGRHEGGPDPEELRARIEDLSREIERLERELKQTRADALESEHALAAFKAETRSTEQLLRAKAERAEEEAQSHRRRLQQIYASRTWKAGWILIAAGRAVRHPGRVLKRVRKQQASGRPDTPAARARRMPGAVADYELEENTHVRDEYIRAVTKTEFETDKLHLAVSVTTTDFAEGRGDLYTAVGLGRYLERIGYEVTYLPRPRWYEPPARTDLYLAMLDTVDLHQLPAGIPAVAWVRNRTTEWANSPSLPLYDAVLCSSEISRAEIAHAYSGPVALLRIGVDAELFAAGESPARKGVATTVNQWGRERDVYRVLRDCRLDFPLAIYGQQRGAHEDLKPVWHGPASFFALPSLYRQAALILDDHNHTTQPYGNVNSRIYESLAAGAPVLTNSAVGLGEVGLGDVPVYESAPDLDARIHEHLRNPAALAGAAARMRDVVLSKHTYERRAAEFDAVARDVLESPAATSRIVVAFFPDYRMGNPYQRLLYSRGPAGGMAALPLADLGSPPPRLTGLGSRLVAHLHWTAPVLGPAETEGEARERARAFVRRIDAVKAGGAKFVWTIHNVLPHECRFPEIESEMRQQIADRADLIHVMCAETAELVAPHYRLPPERVRVVPHPSYVDVYPNLMDQDEARAELGLGTEHTVFCFFGGIRPYKGLEQLLDAFDDVCRAKPESRLLIVGPAPPNLEGVDELHARCDANPRVIANFNRIADAHVQIFLNAADAAVLPHRWVLNSGSAMLAFSFARPVVAPRAGCLGGLLTPDVGLMFDPEDPDGLRAALMRGDELKDERFRKAAYEKARSLSYPAVSEQFIGVIRELVDG